MLPGVLLLSGQVTIRPSPPYFHPTQACRQRGPSAPLPEAREAGEKGGGEERERAAWLNLALGRFTRHTRVGEPGYSLERQKLPQVPAWLKGL